MNEFLKLEYEQCLGLIKYYDERHHSLIRFSVGVSSAVPTLLLTMHTLGKADLEFFWEASAFVLFASTLGLATIFAAMVQNRLYFVYPVRQVNAIRGALLESEASFFKDNQMYVNPNFSAFQWMSVHSLMNGFVALQIGFFLGGFYFSIHQGLKSLMSASIILGLVFAALTYLAAAIYLTIKGKRPADHAVHGEK